MAWLLPGYDVMPKKNDDSVSPYLRKPLRSYEEVQCKPTGSKAPPTTQIHSRRKGHSRQRRPTEIRPNRTSGAKIGLNNGPDTQRPADSALGA